METKPLREISAAEEKTCELSSLEMGSHARVSVAQ